MRSAVRQDRRGAALQTGLLIALIAFGVLLMHSVTTVTSMAGPTTAAMSGDHAAMASTATGDTSVSVAFGKYGCPSAHQIMHPCMGATVSWTALIVPTMSGETDVPATSTDRLGRGVGSTQERAPPWTLWELDRSVTLRV